MRKTITNANGETLVIEGEFDIVEPPEVGDKFDVSYRDNSDSLTAFVGENQLIIKVNGENVTYIERDGWELEPFIPYTGMPSGLANELRDIGFDWDETKVTHNEDFQR